MRNIKALSMSLIYAGANGPLKVRFTCIGVNLMSAVIVLINLTAGPLFYYLSKKPAVLYGSMIEAFLVSIIIILNSRRLYAWANLLFFIILNAATFYFASILGRDVNAQVMILYLLCLSYFLYSDNALRFVCIGFTLITFAALEYNYNQNLVPALEFSIEVRTIMRICSYCVITLLVFLLIYWYAKINEWSIKKLEEANEYLETDLMSLAELSSKRKTFLRDTTHEIWNGFRPIRGMIGYLKESERKRLELSSASVDQLVQGIRSTCDSYVNLLKNILHFNKIEHNAEDKLIIEQFEVKPFFHQIIEPYQFFGKEMEVVINLKVQENVPEYLNSDTVKLRQILYNLRSNALKFSKREADIFVDVELGESNTWTVSVTNEGAEITREDLEKAFKPFQSERSGINVESNGLGLFITRKLVDALQGDIEVRQMSGLLTTFYITLPLEIKMEKQVV